jgi:hypothetical protein
VTENVTVEEVERRQAKLRDNFHQYVKEWAYRKWVEAGMPEGRSDEFWYKAEEEMRTARAFALEQLRTLYWKAKYEELVASLFVSEITVDNSNQQG